MEKKKKENRILSQTRFNIFNIEKILLICKQTMITTLKETEVKSNKAENRFH